MKVKFRCAVAAAVVMAASIAQAQSNTHGAAVAVDAAGNIYAVGVFSRWADFDSDPVEEAWCGVPNPIDYGGNDGTPLMGYLAKYGPDKALQWVIRLDGIGNQFLSDVAVGADGSVYVVGHSPLVTRFGDYVPAANWDDFAAFIAKVNPGGSVAWMRQIDNEKWNDELEPEELGGPPFAEVVWGESMAVDTTLNGEGIVISGTCRVVVREAPDRIAYEVPYIARFNLDVDLDFDGRCDWVETFEGTGHSGVTDLASDPNGGVFASGEFRGALTMGPDLLINDNDIPDGFIMKVSDDAGNPALRWEWGRAIRDVGSLAAAASDGAYVYVASGDTGNNLTAGNEIIARYSADGIPNAGEWSKSFPNGIALDIVVSGGDLYLTGAFSGTVDFNLDPTAQYNLTSSGPRDIFVWKMSDGGVFEWAGQMGGPSVGLLPNDRGTGIAVDSLGNVVTTGTFLGRPADFNPGAGTETLVRLGLRDAFLSKVSLSMQQQWVFQIGSPDKFADNGQTEGTIAYTESGSGWKSGRSGGYMADYRTHAKGTGSSKATWTVSGLPGGQYEVFATWVPGSKNATNAQYKVNGASAPLVNQRVRPDTLGLNTTVESLATSSWKSLGKYDAQGGTIAVELTDKANGTIVADAIRVLIYQPAGAP